MLIILSGSSGVGKNTIMEELIKRVDNLVTFCSYTTREMRPGESQENPYVFVDKETFLEMAEAGEFYEYEEFHGGKHYGTSKKIIQENLEKGKILIKDVDVKGTMNLVKALADVTKVITIFLTVDKDTLKQRLIDRNEKDIELRLSRYDLEQEFEKEYDYVIQNIEKEDTLKKIIKIIEDNK